MNRFSVPPLRSLWLAAISTITIFAPAAMVTAADWPPALDATNTTTKALDGRAIERYTHGPRAEWGYPESSAAHNEWATPPDQETGVNQQNHACFYVVAPKVPRENAPLCVVLHSANRTAFDYLGYGALGRSLGRSLGNREDPATVMANSPDDFYALYLSSTNAEWWGWSQVHQNEAKKINVAPAAERRVLDTIEWVAARYHVDRNRIYLCGVSMGGCGTLGLGMPHGEIFAAIRANVPAGTGYAADRMGGFAPAPAADAPEAERAAWALKAAGVGLPDPPVIVDFSSQKDNWSKTQPDLVAAAEAGHLPFVLSWGPFGHTTFSTAIAKYPICDVALAFPWLEIRKNEAYPVFTHATCDQRCPWRNAPAPAEFDETGQLNAWFRWKTRQDTPTQFALELWIAHPAVKEAPPAMPETAQADVTPRRMQQFKVQAGKTYAWDLAREGKVLGSGKVMPDAAGLVTIPQVALATGAGVLTIRER